MEAEVISQLCQIVGENNCSTRTADLYAYGFDASIHHENPDIVTRPENTQQVSEIVKLANERKIPVTARGAGTGLCGHAVPLQKGIVMDMCKMNKILEVHVEDLYCVIQPGVVYAQLNKELAKKKFFFPPTPGSGDVCTIGGMVAVNASGMRAIKYGATRDYVLGLEVVLPTGEVMRCGTRTLKNSSGFQLERLFVGSEGMLGIITEINLRVSPLPKARAIAMVAFDELVNAGQCVSNLIAKPLIPSGIEIIDKVCIKAVNNAMKVGFPEVEAMLLVEVDGHPSVVEEEIKMVSEICEESGATSVEFSTDPKTMNKWISGRKAVLPSLSRYGEKFVSVSLADDMSVPMSKIPEAVSAFQEIAERNHVIVGTYGHAADGNLHTKMLLDPQSKQSWKNGEKAVGEIFDAVMALGGTVTGEHGVAISKAPYMQKERPTALVAMKAIKRALDPNNIMNPGKIMDWEGSIISHLRYEIEGE
ncbi:MAG: FAD-binding protein [Thermoplasmata archaeon]|nr:MAG: FAD-binding protein [Thermoplasmata archaeon]